MIVYRLCKSKYARDLSGKGAELSGGRWNSKGVALLYTCESKALCTAEIAVHTPLGILPEDYVLLTLSLPGDSIREITPDLLPADWKSFPHSKSTQTIGNRFVSENQYLVVKVPSAVVQGDFNLLINPNHTRFSEVKIEKTEAFAFDSRLFKRQA